MDITIGLPNAVAGVTRDSLLEWSRRAEAGGFAGVASLDRLVYANYEPLISMAAAGAVTERVRLTTQALLAPWRLNAALLAKQLATLQHLSNGRMVLGIAPGGREDDYTASGTTMKRRGDRLTEMIEEMLRIWEGEERGAAGGSARRLATSAAPSSSSAELSRRRFAAPRSSATAGRRAACRPSSSRGPPRPCAPHGARRAAKATPA
jgi:alkanesulfonate monooxygenase SsuD/methylene tetrahydromethanopterin reductase-like flavin-dependent oxidoreductase (luciferase family)